VARDPNTERGKLRSDQAHLPSQERIRLNRERFRERHRDDPRPPRDVDTLAVYKFNQSHNAKLRGNAKRALLSRQDGLCGDCGVPIDPPTKSYLSVIQPAPDGRRASLDEVWLLCGKCNWEATRNKND